MTTNREDLLLVTAALRKLASALEDEVQTEAEAHVVGCYLMEPVQTLVDCGHRVLNAIEEHRRRSALSTKPPID